MNGDKWKSGCITQLGRIAVQLFLGEQND